MGVTSGLILDTSILIACERRRETVEELLRQIRLTRGQIEVAISSVNVVELTHGMYRARTEQDRLRRVYFTEGVLRTLFVHPVTTDIAKLAGRIEGEQAAIGNIIAFQDLLIGATALHLGFSVATLNTRHFERIPGLTVVSS